MLAAIVIDSALEAFDIANDGIKFRDMTRSRRRCAFHSYVTEAIGLGIEQRAASVVQQVGELRYRHMTVRKVSAGPAGHEHIPEPRTRCPRSPWQLNPLGAI